MARNFLSFLNRVPTRDKVFLVRQLSIMLSSGIPLTNALVLITQQTSNPVIRHALRVMTKDVENGRAFYMAAARHPDLFNEITVAMIKSGETSGQLEKVLSEVSIQLDKDVNFSTKVRNALLYPAFVLFVMIVVGIIMTTVIVPRLSEVFEDTSLTLPWTTKLLIAISNFILNYWVLVILLIVALVYVGRMYIATQSGRQSFYRLQTRVPLIRHLLLNSYLVRFTSTLTMLIRAGVPITEALRIVSDSMVNPIWSKALTSVREEVERGIPLSAALSRHAIFPKPLTQMIAVGEETGKLDSTLATMTTFYEEQTNNTINSITTLIEPIILVIVAIGVGFVVISVILPIYGLAEQF